MVVMCDCLQKIEKTIFDSTLDSTTASQKGYLYVQDIPNLYKTLNDLLQIAEEKGYRIGMANTENNNLIGLYRKANTNEVDF